MKRQRDTPTTQSRRNPVARIKLAALLLASVLGVHWLRLQIAWGHSTDHQLTDQGRPPRNPRPHHRHRPKPRARHHNPPHRTRQATTKPPSQSQTPLGHHRRDRLRRLRSPRTRRRTPVSRPPHRHQRHHRRPRLDRAANRVRPRPPHRSNDPRRPQRRNRDRCPRRPHRLQTRLATRRSAPQPKHPVPSTPTPAATGTTLRRQSTARSCPVDLALSPHQRPLIQQAAT